MEENEVFSPTTTRKVPGDVSTWYIFQNFKEHVRPVLYKMIQDQKSLNILQTCYNANSKI